MRSVRSWSQNSKEALTAAEADDSVRVGGTGCQWPCIFCRSRSGLPQALQSTSYEENLEDPESLDGLIPADLYMLDHRS